MRCRSLPGDRRRSRRSSPTFSTDNRYTDDIHYMGGCLLNDNLWWGSIMLAYQSRPLDPQIVGPVWRERWLERLADAAILPGALAGTPTL
jgi:predicted acyl esterase